MGAAHIGETEFGAGVFYLYLCIDRDLLEENLDDGALARRGIAALVEAAAKGSPSGKKPSFASRALAAYILAEKGDQQPRSLSIAFLKPVRGEDIMAKAIAELENKRQYMEKVYGKCAESTKIMNAETGEGCFSEIITFITE